MNELYSCWSKPCIVTSFLFLLLCFEYCVSLLVSLVCISHSVPSLSPSVCCVGRVDSQNVTSAATAISPQASDDMYSRAYVEPSETLSDYLFADEDEECSDVDVDIEGVDISCAPSEGFKNLGDLLLAQEVRCQCDGL